MIGLVLASLLSLPVDWKSEVQQEVDASPELIGRLIEVCVDADCVSYDRTSEKKPVFGSTGPHFGPRPKVPEPKMYSTVTTPVSAGPEVTIDEPKPKLKPTLDTGPGGGFREMLRDVISSSAIHGEIDVTYKQNSKSPDGTENNTEVRVKISGGTGAKGN